MITLWCYQGGVKLCGATFDNLELQHDPVKGRERGAHREKQRRGETAWEMERWHEDKQKMNWELNHLISLCFALCDKYKHGHVPAQRKCVWPHSAEVQDKFSAIPITKTFKCLVVDNMHTYVCVLYIVSPSTAQSLSLDRWVDYQGGRNWFIFVVGGKALAHISAAWVGTRLHSLNCFIVTFRRPLSFPVSLFLSAALAVSILHL